MRLLPNPPSTNDGWNFSLRLFPSTFQAPIGNANENGFGEAENRIRNWLKLSVKLCESMDGQSGKSLSLENASNCRRKWLLDFSFACSAAWVYSCFPHTFDVIDLWMGLIFRSMAPPTFETLRHDIQPFIGSYLLDFFLWKVNIDFLISVDKFMKSTEKNSSSKFVHVSDFLLMMVKK